MGCGTADDCKDCNVRHGSDLRGEKRRPTLCGGRGPTGFALITRILQRFAVSTTRSARISTC
jgi:hypothetical protein